MIFLLVAGVTALATFLASALTLRFALRYKIHPPVRERDVHSVPTPRLGGVAMFLGVCVAFATAAFLPQFQNVFADPGSVIALLGATLFIVVIGIADDLLDLDWMIKLGAQFLAAGLVAWQGVQILSLPIGGITVGSSTMSMILTIFTIVLVMNAVNFIDGLDGLVAGVTLIGSGAFFVYINVLSRDMGQQNTYFSLASLITAVLIGACIGFLPYNWH
ncbi:MraY family glycosyltransferase [Humidisolicoccus flavus]|uniref:MraY family glycosyltransferase n=1 Tax=Humidisolicoccus flavus TaxID=3111414 RepID=UPI003D3014F8